MDHKKQQAEDIIKAHPGWYAWMSLRRAVYLWTGYWSFDRAYLEMEPTDPANIPFATSLTLLAILGLILTWRERPFETLRYGGILFLFPMIYYFSHPEPYHMRPLDPLMLVLSCSVLVAWHERVRKRATVQAPAEEALGDEVRTI